jgi:hypothetical protein
MEDQRVGRIVSFGNFVPHHERFSRRDGCGSTRLNAVLDRYTSLPDQHFRGPRWTILTIFVSISPDRINCNDQVYRHAPILDHSGSARGNRGYRWRDRHPVGEPPSAEIDSSSLPGASYLHELDQWSGQHNQDRNIDRTSISNTVGNFSAGILERFWSVAGYRTLKGQLMPPLLFALFV